MTAIRYVVACRCEGRALAYIDDARADGGELRIRKAPQVTGQKWRPLPHGPRRSTTSARLAPRWQDASFTDNGSSWVVRCEYCSGPDQAQINTANLERLADRLYSLHTAGAGALPPVTARGEILIADLYHKELGGYIGLDVLVRGLSRRIG